MKLIDYLHKNKITIKKAADELGVHPGYLSLLVNDRRKCSRQLADDIEKFTKGKVLASSLVSKKRVRERCPTCGRMLLKQPSELFGD